jgi:hypothetical protein
MGVVCPIYDPLGLICLVTRRFKILLKEIHRIPSLEWDTPLLNVIQQRWCEAIKDMENMDDIIIPRSVKPEGTKDELELVGYWDGADPAFAACLYTRWELLSDNNVKTYTASCCPVPTSPT